ncbi:hypothetical protein HT127_23120 [Pseudomonas aeruginosa]|uniref:hypothetical protein n=1 Tax=Pseudomonas aeruginosa TaxID=287 RepID=UPI000710EA5E|nr:hypothetical protein [Pseudomonas aeruginosa]EIU7169545.1 hypothetical protein [Pseudomonas aeruginosa]KSR06249.1 hypothetical protein APB37_22255 [Pseudomonas aeruginosa]NTT93090.1 hypothetical protein [Pseudomonas aeruginosa]HCF3155681.1 hypothetical protein [Pseudomonas aeruginosa]HDR2968692.1 hypothetical protein [Pseudomonas aeruginosa]
MGRSADYTIQGFLYQFNQTLAELLKAADEAEITIEGIVEDIEVATFTGTKAIQCKYHETKDKYTPSILYDPLLQMMKHFKSNPSAKITYHLYAHFPNAPTVTISAADLNSALASKNKDLQTLISEVSGVDVNEFLKVFSVTVTPKYDDLTEENTKLLEKLGFNKGEVETLFYPNAIQIIADLSIKHNETLRKITKRDFLDSLRRIRHTAISQWTLALKTRQKILEARRKQLKENLSANVRLRFLVIFPEFLERFDDQIVLFIKSFIDKYHYKQAHTHTPLFALDIPQDLFDEIAERLIGKDVIPNLGRPVKTFSESNFFREPMISKDKKEFDLRLILWEDYKNLQLKIKADDIFVIGVGDTTSLDLKDVNFEALGADNFDEVKYMLGMSNAY